MGSSEQELIKKLAEAEKEVLDSTRALSEARRRWTDAETDVIGAKLNRDRAKEELRVHRATTPKHEPNHDDLEIERFRQANPELCAWARERDAKRGSDE